MDLSASPRTAEVSTQSNASKTWRGHELVLFDTGKEYFP